MKKQIIAAVLAMSACITSSTGFAQIPQDVKGTRYEDAVSLLSALKIMNGDENGEYRLDDTIIRSEMTKMAITAMGMETAAQSSAGLAIYDDVNQEHWASGYINLATNLGIVEGDGDGNFRPNAPITYQEAVAIMVRATGHETAATSKGGYPQGYLNVASENKMLRNVEGQKEMAITRGNVAMLTNNSLEVKKMEQTGFGPYPEYSIVNKTLLGDNLKTEIKTGQIRAVGKTALAGVTAVTEGRIMLDDKLYDCSAAARNMIGYNVEAYIRQGNYSNQEVILVKPIKTKNNTLEIKADLFEYVGKKDGNDTISYYEKSDSGKTKTAVIEKDAQIIYNNRNVAYNTEIIDISNRQAYMSMLDSDNNGKFDIIFITEYENIVVERANDTKITAVDGTTLKLEDNQYKLYNGYNEIEPKTLRKWDVLSVIKSPTDDYTEMYLTRGAVGGKVTSKGKDWYKIDGVEYKLAADFTDDIPVGESKEFLLDIEGKIAAVKEISTMSTNYAYMTNMYETSDRDNVKVKLVDKTGDIKIVDMADKVKINGTSFKDTVAYKTLVENEVSLKQLITYSMNSSEKITAINIAQDKSSLGTADTVEFTLNKRIEDVIYDSATSKLDNIRVTGETIVFDISNIENIKVTNAGVFSDKQKYSGLVYDMSESYDAGVIVLTDTAFKPEINAPIAVIKEISRGVNDNEEMIDIATLLINGEEITLNATDDSTLIKGDSAKLEPGDIIQYKTNEKNEIAGIRLLFDITKKNTEFKEEPETDLEIIYGKITKKFDNSINASVNNSNEMNYRIDENARVYVIESNNAKTLVGVSKFDEVSVYESEDENRIFIKNTDYPVKELVIIK